MIWNGSVWNHSWLRTVHIFYFSELNKCSASLFLQTNWAFCFELRIVGSYNQIIIIFSSHFLLLYFHVEHSQILAPNFRQIVFRRLKMKTLFSIALLAAGFASLLAGKSLCFTYYSKCQFYLLITCFLYHECSQKTRKMIGELRS